MMLKSLFFIKPYSKSIFRSTHLMSQAYNPAICTLTSFPMRLLATDQKEPPKG